MAHELEMSIEEFQDALVQISNSTIAALDELWTVSDSSGDQISLLDTLHDPDAPDPEKIVDASELKDRVADAISRLPEREKLVIALYYYENLTLREIGEVLGVTESRISQLHTKAVLRLRSRLQARTATPTRQLTLPPAARARAVWSGAEPTRGDRACTSRPTGSATSHSSDTAAAARRRCTRRCCSRREPSAGSARVTDGTTVSDADRTRRRARCRSPPR